jgi:hypothetical protein
MKAVARCVRCDPTELEQALAAAGKGADPIRVGMGAVRTGIVDDVVGSAAPHSRAIAALAV